MHDGAKLHLFTLRHSGRVLPHLWPLSRLIIFLFPLLGAGHRMGHVQSQSGHSEGLFYLLFCCFFSPCSTIFGQPKCIYQHSVLRHLL